MSGPPRRTHLADRFSLAVTNLPSRLPVVFFWCALVICLAVILGWFHPLVVLPGIAVAVATTWRMVPEAVPRTRDFQVGARWALGLAVGWVVVNVAWSGEVLLVQRDPGFLTLEGVWLTTHADPSIPIRSAAEVAAQVPGLSVISDAFWRFGDQIHAQGAKTFPGLIAMLGWVGGLRAVLAGNILIGGIALLAVYDVARRLISPLWGLIPVLALALTTPMIYFSRSAFTEPTNVVLTFGGLAVLWSAARDHRLWRFALGGAMLGSTALSRIDGAAVSAGLIVGLGMVAAVSSPGLRRRWIVGTLVAGGAALAMVGLGYLELRTELVGLPGRARQPVRAAHRAARSLPGGLRPAHRGAARGPAPRLARRAETAPGHRRRLAGGRLGRAAREPAAVDAPAPDRARLRAGVVHRGCAAGRGVARR